MTAPARFKQEDIARAMGGARKAGFTNLRIAIDVRGNIVIEATDAPIAIAPDRRNPLDRLLPPE